MRKTAVITLLCLGAAGAPLAADPDRVLTRSFPAKDLAALRFEISVAEVRIEAGGDSVEVTIEAKCRWSRGDCEEELADLELTDRKRGDVLILELDGFPKWGKGKLEIDAALSVPGDLDLDIEMGVGELDIDGLTGEIDVDLGVGEVEIETTSKHLRSVSIDVGVGEAELRGLDTRVEGRRSFLVGSEAYWAGGGGDNRIRVDVGVGEVTVRLD